MSAFLIASVTVKDAEKFQQYGEQAAKTFSTYSGEVLAKGKFAGVYTGATEHHAAAVFQFPSLALMDEWYHSSEYQALIPLRDEAADIAFDRYEVPES